MRDEVALKEARFVTLNAHNLEPIVLSRLIPPTKRDRTRSILLSWWSLCLSTSFASYSP